MSDNIPFDIQMEIIKKVPDVKSLIQFRSVSKPWKVFHRQLQVYCWLRRSRHSAASFKWQVGISWYYRKNQHNIRWQVGIFTLSSKTWNMIPTSNVLRESVRLKTSTRVAIDRFIYWFAYDRPYFILSFDLITHEFKEINLPHSLANQVSLHFSISKLSESLVVSAYTNGGNGLVYEVWMMGEEGGVMQSFTKLFTINTPRRSIKILLGFRKSGEPIMETVTEDIWFAALKVYEPCSKHFNNLGIYGRKGSFFICPYTEALLLIDHSDGCIISNDY